MALAGALLVLVGAGIGLLGGNYWIIVAMRTGDIAIVAPFRYSIILWAILAGFVIWREVPDLPSWIGIAIVTGGGPLHLRARAPAGKGGSNVTDNLRGILAVLAASAAFVLNDAIVKLLSAELPSGEILWFGASWQPPC